MDSLVGTADCFLLSHPDSKCLAQNKPNMILSKQGADPGEVSAQQPSRFLATSTDMLAQGYVVGNGRCGYAYSANSDSSLFPVTPGMV